MASFLLASLPHVGRETLDKENQHCPMCMEEYGAVPAVTGIVERAARLPCTHVIGSECIQTWLDPDPAIAQHSNNTSPICRHELFRAPQQSPPDWRNIPQSMGQLDIQTQFIRYISFLAPPLSLSPETNGVVLLMVGRIHTLEPPGDYSVVALAAASFYMASHAMADSRDLPAVSRGVAETGFSDVGSDDIQRTYSWLYQQRRQLLHEPFLLRATGRTLGTVDEFLPQPSLGPTTLERLYSRVTGWVYG